MSNHQALFCPLFTREENTSEKLISILSFNKEGPSKDFLIRYLQSLDEERLKEVVLFRTGSNVLPKFSKIQIQIENSEALYWKTCISTIFMPEFDSYGFLTQLFKRRRGKSLSQLCEYYIIELLFVFCCCVL